MDKHSQNHYKKKRGMRRYYNPRDSRRNPAVPFYLIKQHRNGGSEERYGSFYNPSGTQNLNHDLSPLSISSMVTASAETSSVSSDKSHGEIDPDVKEITIAEVFQKFESFMSTVGVLGESEIQKKPLKLQMKREKKIVTVLSPLAKVFVPRVKSRHP